MLSGVEIFNFFVSDHLKYNLDIRVLMLTLEISFLIDRVPMGINLISIHLSGYGGVHPKS